MANEYFESLNFDELPSDLALKAEFYDCEFSKIQFDTDFFKNSKFIDCRFMACDASNVNLTNTTFRDCYFNNCKLIGVNWCNSQNIALLKFDKCLIDLSTFQSMDLSQFSFDESRLRDVDFSDAVLVNSSFVSCDLENANFNGANVKDSDFRKATNYFIDPHFTQLGKSKFNLPEANSFFKAIGVVIEP